MRKIILATNSSPRTEALNKLLPYQQNDFYGILKAMTGYPVTIRLLDPPLHEFLPTSDEQIKSLLDNDVKKLCTLEEALKVLEFIEELQDNE